MNNSNGENIIIIYTKNDRDELLKFYWNGYTNHDDGYSLLLMMEEKPFYYKSQLKTLLYSALSNENIYSKNKRILYILIY